MRVPEAGLVTSWAIAIVDDDDAVRLAIMNLLHSAGHATLEFSSAEELLSCASTVNICCALIDVTLRGMDGITLQAQLRAIRPLLPVIFITGSFDASAQRRALQGGALAFLYKPIDPDELLQRIQEALDAPAGGQPENGLGKK